MRGVDVVRLGAADQALVVIEQVSHGALAEPDHVLALLTEQPRPPAAAQAWDLGGLMDTVARTGLPVRLQDAGGQSALSALSEPEREVAHRVVQESLTDGVAAGARERPRRSLSARCRPLQRWCRRADVQQVDQSPREPLLTVQPHPHPLPVGVDLGAAVVASTAALVCVVGADGRILLVNPALERVTGWSGTEVMGRLFWDVLVVPEEAELAEDFVARAVLTGEAADQEGDWLDRWGGRRRVAMTNSVLLDHDRHPCAVVLLGIDVTARRLVEAQLRSRATTDALTGLPNRDSLLRAVQDELADPTSTGCGLLFCDLDGFKAANDTHGHDIGDLLLREVGDRLLAVTEGTELAARYGGDEFVVLSRGGDAHRTHQLRSAIKAAVDAPFTTPHGLVHLGVSVGVAVGRHGEQVEHLIAAADRHMYGVKTRRRAERDRQASDQAAR